MRYIEATGIRLAHIADDETPLAALCGMRAFPWDWHQPVKRKKDICRGCLNVLRNKRS